MRLFCCYKVLYLHWKFLWEVASRLWSIQSIEEVKLSRSTKFLKIKFKKKIAWKNQNCLNFLRNLDNLPYFNKCIVSFITLSIISPRLMLWQSFNSKFKPKFFKIAPSKFDLNCWLHGIKNVTPIAKRLIRIHSADRIIANLKSYNFNNLSSIIFKNSYHPIILPPVSSLKHKNSLTINIFKHLKCNF